MATKEKAVTNSSAQQGKNKPAKNNPKKSDNTSIVKRGTGYLKDVKSELHRVVWPTKNDVVNYTLVVLGTLVFFGVLITIIDSIIIPVFVAFAGLR